MKIFSHIHSTLHPFAFSLEMKIKLKIFKKKKESQRTSLSIYVHEENCMPLLVVLFSLHIHHRALVSLVFLLFFDHSIKFKKKP